jgi:periplasmic divalent cation tolerance protein
LSDYLQVTTATDSGPAAERIASELVSRRLAACVQIVGPVQSVYRWQGKVERAEEWLLFVKTVAEQFAAVDAAIRSLHTYETPEIIATPITAGSDAYLGWLAEQVRKP